MGPTNVVDHQIRGPVAIRLPGGVGALEPVPCISVCGFVVRGAGADLARFRRDVARANQIYQQCGLQIAEGPFAEIDHPAWLDHPDWICRLGTTRAADAMFAEARSRCQASSVVMLYIRSMGGGSVGCGGPALAGDQRPGFVNTDAASRNSFAHEIGHILFGFAHSTDPANLMFAPSANIVADPPQLTSEQCRATAGAAVVHACGPVPPPPPVAGPRFVPIRSADVVSPVREWLLSADEGDLGVLVDAGDALVPELGALAARDPVPVVRVRAVETLGRIGGGDALQALCRAAGADGHPVVRVTAAHHLGRLGGPAEAPVLAGLLHDRDAGVRLAALRGLGVLSGWSPVAAAAVARAAGRDPSPHVRASAQGLLE